jgi:hypothetical protein
MSLAIHQAEAKASDSHASWENEGGAVSSATRRSDNGRAAQLLLSTESTQARSGGGSDVADDIVSLNAYGGRNWFIPPYVIPSAIAALVVLYAAYRS